MEINVEKLKEAINEAKKIILEGNEIWLTEKGQKIAKIAIGNFIIKLSEILAINA